MIKAIVFDFDGTILDTESAEYETWQEVYRRFGQELPLKQWSEIVGSAGHTFDLLSYLEQLVGRPLPREEMRAERRPEPRLAGEGVPRGPHGDGRGIAEGRGRDGGEPRPDAADADDAGWRPCGRLRESLSPRRLRRPIPAPKRPPGASSRMVPETVRPSASTSVSRA